MSMIMADPQRKGSILKNYKGVYPSKNSGYIAKYNYSGSFYEIGTFKRPEEAAKAYDKINMAYKKDKAKTNYSKTEYLDFEINNAKRAFEEKIKINHTSKRCKSLKPWAMAAYHILSSEMTKISHVNLFNVKKRDHQHQELLNEIPTVRIRDSSAFAEAVGRVSWMGMSQSSKVNEDILIRPVSGDQIFHVLKETISDGKDLETCFEIIKNKIENIKKYHMTYNSNNNSNNNNSNTNMSSSSPITNINNNNTTDNNKVISTTPMKINAKASAMTTRPLETPCCLTKNMRMKNEVDKNIGIYISVAGILKNLITSEEQYKLATRDEKEMLKSSSVQQKPYNNMATSNLTTKQIQVQPLQHQIRQALPIPVVQQSNSNSNSTKRNMKSTSSSMALSAIMATNSTTIKIGESISERRKNFTKSTTLIPLNNNNVSNNKRRKLSNDICTNSNVMMNVNCTGNDNYASSSKNIIIEDEEENMNYERKNGETTTEDMMMMKSKAHRTDALLWLRTLGRSLWPKKRGGGMLWKAFQPNLKSYQYRKTLLKIKQPQLQSKYYNVVVVGVKEDES